MESLYLNFKLVGKSDSGKTSRWAVFSKFGIDSLGNVAWFGAWRKYAFYPKDGIFDPTCLRDIADFMAEQTRKHKKQYQEGCPTENTDAIS